MTKDNNGHHSPALSTEFVNRSSDGTLVPADFQRPSYGSAALGWRGFTLERHFVSPGAFPQRASPNHLMCLSLSRTSLGSVTWRIEGQRLLEQMVPEQVYLQAAEEVISGAYTASMHALFLSVDASSIAWACDLLQVKGSHPLRHMLRTRQAEHGGTRDDQGLRQLMLQLHACARGQNSNGSLYEETLLLAVSLHTVRLFRADGRRLDPPARSGALPPWKRAAVQDYILNNLPQPITLDDIARVVHTSTFHLCRQFRKTMSMSLWQYVLKCRVAYAKRLITRHPDMSLTEVANASGFDSYSAFFNAFRKVHGVSPSGRQN